MLNPTRTLNHHPLFQIMLALQNAPEGAFQLPGLTIDIAPGRTGTAKFDLFFSLVEKRGPHGEPEGITGAIEYSSDLYDETTVHTLFERLTRILETATDHPDQPLSHIDALSPHERHQVLDSWLETATEVGTGLLPARFSEQASATPDAVSLVAGDTVLTYAELDRRANRLARVLLDRGAGAGHVTAIGCRARPTWWWHCWQCSSPAAPTCRSTPTTRRHASRTSWRTPAPHCCSRPRRRTG
ncbi:AMP-binding protein [Streptomyces sp. SCSIO-PteL053]|nr:AMP-binding protein [Streptomyces sp. SCSIO-PteL053]